MLRPRLKEELRPFLLEGRVGRGHSDALRADSTRRKASSIGRASGSSVRWSAGRAGGARSATSTISSADHSWGPRLQLFVEPHLVAGLKGPVSPRLPETFMATRSGSSTGAPIK